MQTSQLPTIARSLIREELLSPDRAEQCLTESKNAGLSFIRYLATNDVLKEADLLRVASDEFGVPYFDLDALDRESIPKEQIKEELLRKHHALPIYKRGHKLFIAVSDPTNMKALDEFKFATGLSTDAVLVWENKLGSLIDNVIDEASSSVFDDLEDEGLEGIDIGEDIPASDDGVAVGEDDAPIVKYVNKLLLDAIKRGASDLHFEPYEKEYRVRFRMDGVLVQVASPPNNLASRLAARLKVMSQMDIAERRIPQDGRMKMRLSKNRAIDFRVSSCPTLFGEKIVLRILDPSSTTMGIDMLGYAPDQKELFISNIKKPQGMVLVTGPTGSGKTVSLYTALNILNTPEVNISTAEDPVEFNFKGINQVNVNPKAGLDFSAALRSFLRQDPDIVMVGEIRDLETAEIAIKAAQTGHLVLSTLHTNSAPETLNRLVNMGVAPYNIAGTVNLVIAQRLARRLCSKCKKQVALPDEALIEAGFQENELGNLEVFEPVGCPSCVGGYKGRVGLYQVMPVSDGISRIIMEGGNSIQIADQAKKENIPDLRRSGLDKVKEGVTSLAEVHRVTTD
ncbi:MAG: type IV-A pilus assembly ATPase PilB [Kangiellaceae bacterium]|jgi:type IV pilus assembly protein PilB|nr:type IV-A pilus assembly ATPase PilB [Kangiellaceae bacterium]|tara:strand:- start:1697 stop:3397 length:1701 start_codon:yes stop_codon:yes gene_type:complete